MNPLDIVMAIAIGIPALAMLALELYAGAHR